MLGRFNEQNQLEPALAAENGKFAVINYFIEEIIDLTSSVIAETQDPNVLPWDIQTAIGYDNDLSKLFGIGKEDKQLPVTVTVGPQQFTHMLTEEFTMGLLIFSDKHVGNNNFHVTLFGIELPSDYLFGTFGEHLNELTPRFIGRYNIRTNYTVDMANFNTPDFMQGFATGAMWTGVDHHAYWKNLVQHNGDTQIPITF